jgi:hypothetical protein
VVSCCGLWLLLFTAVMGRVRVGIQDGVFGSFLFFCFALGIAALQSLGHCDFVLVMIA